MGTQTIIFSDRDARNYFLKPANLKILEWLAINSRSPAFVSRSTVVKQGRAKRDKPILRAEEPAYQIFISVDSIFSLLFSL